MPEASAMTQASVPDRGRVTEGRAEAVFATDAEGRTFLARQYASYPFHVCRAQYLDPDQPDMASLYLQSSAGGLFAGDRLALSFATHAGARAHVTTAASTIVYRMEEGEARQTTALEARPDSLLEYLPDPAILFPQARLHSHLSLRLAAGARAIVGESFLAHDPAGMGEPFGLFESEMQVTDWGGRLLALDRFRVTGAEMNVRIVGVNGPYLMQGTLLVLGDGLESGLMLAALRAQFTQDPAVHGGVSTLPNGAGIWARILAAEGAALTSVMTSLWSAARCQLTGVSPAQRRK
jgi:urease accessory protein